MLQLLLSTTYHIVRFWLKAFVLVLPALLVFISLNFNSLLFLVGESHPSFLGEKQVIHELIPNATWNDLEPCGLHFNEQEEFKTALQCVNKSVWSDSPLVKDWQTHIPRCFIIKAGAVDIFTTENAGFNFIPIVHIAPDGIRAGGVVGVYQPETRTVFVVENIDAAKVYRHELQHYFLHMHDPETQGGGHDQNIWKQCEPPYYTPSEEVINTVKIKASKKD